MKEEHLRRVLSREFGAPLLHLHTPRTEFEYPNDAIVIDLSQCFNAAQLYRSILKSLGYQENKKVRTFLDLFELLPRDRYLCVILLHPELIIERLKGDILHSFTRLYLVLPQFRLITISRFPWEHLVPHVHGQAVSLRIPPDPIKTNNAPEKLVVNLGTCFLETNQELNTIMNRVPPRSTNEQLVQTLPQLLEIETRLPEASRDESFMIFAAYIGGFLAPKDDPRIFGEGSRRRPSKKNKKEEVLFPEPVPQERLLAIFLHIVPDPVPGERFIDLALRHCLRMGWIREASRANHMRYRINLEPYIVHQMARCHAFNLNAHLI